MTMDYLSELENEVDSGRPYWACPGQGMNEWYISDDLEDLKKKAQRTANAKKYPATIFKLINKMDTTSGDAYLVVRKILDPGPKGEPHLNWTIVDTREAAELMRDVSQGPTPYFGATQEETFDPK